MEGNGKRNEDDTDKKLVVLGAGPAGLSCAYEFMRHGRRCIVWDKNTVVGGLARTIEYNGYRFDIGPHRFFTKNDEVDKFWHEILGEDALQVKRLTRIFYNNKFFNYPLKPCNALFGLGLYTSARALLSYAGTVQDDTERLAIYQNVLKLDPQNTVARMQIGVQHLKNGDLAPGVREFKRVVQLDSDVKTLSNHIREVNDAVLEFKRRGYQCNTGWLEGLNESLELLYMIHLRGYEEAAKVGVEKAKVLAARILDELKCVKRK